jgi:hypothetical protein
MKKDKVILLLILVSYFIVSMIFWYFSDSISLWAMSANSLFVTLVNLILNPFYVGSIILIMELFFRGLKLNRTGLNYFRVIVASILLSLSLDILSLPHSLSINYILPTSPNVSLYFDTVLSKMLFPILGSLGKFGSFIIYVVISFILVLLSLLIASSKHFISLFKSEIGYRQ